MQIPDVSSEMEDDDEPALRLKQVPTTPLPVEITSQPAWQTMLAPWWRATRAILPIFIATRVLFLILTYFGAVLFTLPNYSGRSLAAHTVLYSWNRWDAVLYGQVAVEGYKRFNNAAFYPLFPLLEHIVSRLLHIDVFVAGMLISNVASLAMLIVLYRFVETEFDGETAGRTVLYLAIFPSAFFFFTAFNESLFILFVLLSFYAMRRRLWWLAGLSGALAMSTRAMALLLLPIFLYEFIRQEGPQIRQDWTERRRGESLRRLSAIFAALLIPLSLGIFAVVLNQQLHDPLAFLHAEKSWRQPLTFPWTTIFISIGVMLRATLFSFATAHIIIDLGGCTLFVALLVLCLVGPERFSLKQWPVVIFALIVLLYPLLVPGKPTSPTLPYDPLPSMERFLLEAFPAFILLARLGRRPWFHQAYLLFALPLLAFFVLQFLTGHWTV